MSENIPGLGRKRPLLNIPISSIKLDPDNPRLANEIKGGSQSTLLKHLYKDFNLQELALSMSSNGYFDEEPIVVVPENISEDFEYSDNIDQLQIKLQDLVNKGQLSFIVVEGNRRLATLKLLTDEKVREEVKLSSEFPKVIASEVINDLKVVPSIFYKKREEISAYLGVRHITGLLKWEAYAKAVFVADRIEDLVKVGKTYEESISAVRNQIADRSDVIRKQYLCYKVIQQAEEDLGFNIENIKNKFSLLTVALNAPTIREFIGISSYKNVDFSTSVVKGNNISRLENILIWIFGNGQDKMPILTDSRKITSRLAPVLGDEYATEHLLKYGNLEEAYEMSGGEKKFLIKKINDATKSLRYALGLAYKYKESDILAIINDCVNAAEQLKKMVKDDQATSNQ